MRKGIGIFIALVLAAGLAVNASAQRRKARTMRAISVSGDIQIILPDGTVKGRKKGTRIGNIPAGAKIKVISGTAIFQIGNTVIRVEKGDQFTFTLKQGNVSINSLSGTVSVTAGGKTQILAKGKTATVPIVTKLAKAKKAVKKGKKGKKTGTGDTSGGDGGTGDSTPPSNPNAEEGLEGTIFVTCVPDVVTPIGPDICTTTYQ